MTKEWGVRGIINKSALMLISQVVQRGALVLASMLISRYGPTDAFSSFSILNLACGVVVSYFTLGLSYSAGRVFAAASDARQQKRVSAIGTGVIILSVLAAVFAYLFPELLVSGNANVPRELLALAAGVLVAQGVFQQVLIALGEYRSLAISGILSCVTLLSMVAIGVKMHSVYAILVSYVAWCAVTLGLQVLSVFRRAEEMRLSLLLTSGVASVYKELRVSMPIMLTSIIGGSGPWLVGRLLLRNGSGGEFETYSIGLQLFALGMVVPSAVTNAVFRYTFRNEAGERRGALKPILKSACIASGSSLVVALVVLLVSDRLLALYGKQSASAALTIYVMLFAAVLASPLNILGNAIVARHGQLVWAIVTSTWLAVLLGAVNILGQGTSIMVGLAYCVAYFTELALVFYILLFRRK